LERFQATMHLQFNDYIKEVVIKIEVIAVDIYFTRSLPCSRTWEVIGQARKKLVHNLLSHHGNLHQPNSSLQVSSQSVSLGTLQGLVITKINRLTNEPCVRLCLNGLPETNRPGMKCMIWESQSSEPVLVGYGMHPSRLQNR
jgi:hypothetical protein